MSQTVRNPPRFNYGVKEYIPDLGRMDRELLKERSKFAWFLCRCCANLCMQDYMVKDEVWSAAFIQPRAGVVCLSCLEERLIHHRRQRLELDDFTEAPINHVIKFGHMMGWRNAQRS